MTRAHPARKGTLRARFPGEHVTRTRIQEPGGGFVEFEGAIDKDVAVFLMAALVSRSRITDEMRFTLKSFALLLNGK